MRPDRAVGQHAAGLVADLELMARQHLAADHEAPGAQRIVGIGRRLGTLRLGEHDAVDHVGAHAACRPG